MTQDQARELMDLHEANINAATRFALGMGTAEEQIEASRAFSSYVNSLTDWSRA